MRWVLGGCLAAVLLFAILRSGGSVPPPRKAAGPPASAPPPSLPAASQPPPAEPAPQMAAASIVADIASAIDTGRLDEIDSLAATVSREHVAELIDLARGGPDARTRAFATVLLGFEGAPEAVPLLSRLLREEASPVLRLLAAKSLSRCGREGAYDALRVAATGDSDARVRFMALDGMRRLGADSLEVDLRIAAAREADGATMRAAVAWLGASVLETLVADEGASLPSRAEAFARLAEARPESCAALYAALRDASLKDAAIHSLAAASRVSELRSLYGAEPDEARRAEMMVAVRRAVPPEAKEWLQWVAASDPSPLVRREAERALASYP